MTTTSQPITPELRKWIVEQAQAGFPPETVLKSMLASGWSEDVAVEAMRCGAFDFLTKPFDGKRLVYGGFLPVVHLGE